MGQYYRFIALDKENKPKATIVCYRVHEGGKLMEQSYYNSPYIKLFETLFANECYGDKLIWCGDYCDGDLYSETNDLANECEERYKKLIEKINNKDKTLGNHRYIINLDKGVYIDLQDCGEIYPVPILCSNSNGRGGGDYYGTNMDLVGAWSGDRIGVNDEVPENFKEVKIEFSEKY